MPHRERILNHRPQGWRGNPVFLGGVKVLKMPYEEIVSKVIDGPGAWGYNENTIFDERLY